MPDLFGIDLAWRSDKNHSGLVYGSVEDGRVVIHEVLADLARVDDVVAVVAQRAGRDAVVAVDARLVIRNETGQRPCKEACSRRFGSAHAGAHTSNRTLYPG